MAVIGLDATNISASGKGISRYQYNLIKSLAQIDKQNIYYVFMNKRNAFLDLPKQENFRYVWIKISKRIIWDQLQLPAIFSKYRPDIFHSSQDTLPFFAKGIFLLFLFEIPDYRIELARKHNYNFYSGLSYGYTKLFFSASLKKAKFIITSSQSTKLGLMEKYNIADTKIRVIYPAAEEQFQPAHNIIELTETKRKYNAENGYILHFSSSDPRDNTVTVIAAYKKVLERLNFSKKLVIGGNIEPIRAYLAKLIDELSLNDRIIFAGYLTGEDLVKLYQAADLFVDATLYEGFGFHILEAMSCAIPVVTTDVGSLPEIAGDAGILLEPMDAEKIASAIINVFKDTGLRESMSRKSLERAKRFSWDNTAKETLQVYNKLLCP